MESPRKVAPRAQGRVTNVRPRRGLDAPPLAAPSPENTQKEVRNERERKTERRRIVPTVRFVLAVPSFSCRSERECKSAETKHSMTLPQTPFGKAVRGRFVVAQQPPV